MKHCLLFVWVWTLTCRWTGHATQFNVTPRTDYVEIIHPQQTTSIQLFTVNNETFTTPFIITRLPDADFGLLFYPTSTTNDSEANHNRETHGSPLRQAVIPPNSLPYALPAYVQQLYFLPTHNKGGDHATSFDYTYTTLQSLNRTITVHFNVECERGNYVDIASHNCTRCPEGYYQPYLSIFTHCLPCTTNASVSATKPRTHSPSQSDADRTYCSAASTLSLVERVTQLIPYYRQQISHLKQYYANKKLADLTVGQVISGMRGIIGLLTETSLLDANEGIRFRGFSIPEIQTKLPKAANGEEPLPEGLFWLLLTGEIPSEQQVRQLTTELHQRSKLPHHVVKLLNNLPQSMHPMTALVTAVAACQTESKFAAAYQRGVAKTDYWKYTLEDSLDLIAKLPEIAAIIYRNKFHNGRLIQPDSRLDYSANFAHQLGFDDAQFHELMRLYLTIHSDHEGGNVSAHTTHLVGSALSDPYLSFAAGMSGLAGPLHGLANQEVLNWILEFKQQFGSEEITKEKLVEACWKTLKAGRVIPGYGHAVLRKTDPRYTCQREFALKHLPNDPLFQLVSQLYEVVPKVLTEHGKTANPYPNVDAHSGVLLQYYGLRESEYYTVLFGVSRAMGVLSQLVIDRIQGLPIERPKSVNSQWIRNKFAN